MEKNYLNPPNPRVVTKILSRLQELGQWPSSDSVEIIVAAFEEWLTQTNEGREYLVDKFQFDWVEGREDREYEVTLANGSDTICRGDQVFFLKTCVAKGEFVPPHQVFEYEKEKQDCLICGKLLHCTRLVRHRDYDDKVYICNHCIEYIEQQDIRNEGGGLEECSRCPANTCEYHPEQCNANVVG